MRNLLIAACLTLSPLFADGASIGGFDVMQFLPFALIFVIFYFLILRPQQKKSQAHQDMLSKLRRGDKVVTSGGIIGTVDKVNDHDIVLEIAPDVKVHVVKSTILDVRSKTQPVNESTKNPVTRSNDSSDEDLNADSQQDSPVKSKAKTPAKKVSKK